MQSKKKNIEIIKLLLANHKINKHIINGDMLNNYSDHQFNELFQDGNYKLMITNCFFCYAQ